MSSDLRDRIKRRIQRWGDHPGVDYILKKDALAIIDEEFRPRWKK